MGFIRFILASIVVLCHTSPLFSYQPIPSDLAVQIFYVISGFYMTLVLNEKYLKGNNLKFYKNRALKIYPIYWIILVGLVFWGVIVFKLGYPGTLWFYDYAAPLHTETWIYLIIANIFIIGLDLTFLMGIENGRLYFTPNFGTSDPNVYNFSFNSIAWTIGVELTFYIIAPFILRKGLKIPLLIFFGSIFLRVVLSNMGYSSHPWDYMFFPNQLMYFMGGCLSYHFYKYLRLKKINQRIKQISFMLLISLILFYSYILPNDLNKQIVVFSLIILLIPISFIYTKDSKIDRYLGNLSYPIYVSQILIINITRANAFPKIFGLGFTTLTIVLMVSVLLERFIARRIERLKLEPTNMVVK
ncbi:acyltransferase family protein [Pedobacter sp. UBA5917]|jgi:peptidoglycan/LPS O-acetylase OafA/YrhL|uniref:acyltransferase family protein n=1 Tax=Pedobacter sp. UBA5917 TaxID=1947061 RepID=UPI0025F9E510|nr:acyltransferase [Pedobacter sp. UBA5917]